MIREIIIIILIIIIIQFDSVRVYLRAKLTAQRPITKSAQVYTREIHKNKYKNKIQNMSVYKCNKLIIIIPRKIKVIINRRE
jgi:hypothetical protein